MFPILPARAFRDASGRVQLTRRALHQPALRLGPELQPPYSRMPVGLPFSPITTPDPAAFDDSEWIGSTYTLRRKYDDALLHSEYHGWEHPGQCSVTTTFSTAGGTRSPSRRRPTAGPARRRSSTSHSSTPPAAIKASIATWFAYRFQSSETASSESVQIEPTVTSFLKASLSALCFFVFLPSGAALREQAPAGSIAYISSSPYAGAEVLPQHS